MGMMRRTPMKRTPMRRDARDSLRDQRGDPEDYIPVAIKSVAKITRRAVMAPSNDAVYAQPKEETAAKPGKRAPTAAEREWMDAIVAYGCIACRIDGHAPRPTAVHHILRGGQRIGHLFTLPLCDPGHHQGGEPLGLTSRHPWKARFEERYGTEMVLLEILKGNIPNWAEAA